MRKLRAAVVAVFILSLIAYIGYNIMTRMTQDKVPPVITAESDAVSVSVEDDESKMLEGLQATDNKDGDLTECNPGIIDVKLYGAGKTDE